MANSNLTKNIVFTIATIGVFILSLVLRLWKITEYPVSLSMDEVAIGYNAYSILKTGHDEWGAKFPLAFKSAFDYKPPVNIYLTIPSIMIFGLNEFSVRLPVVLLGSLTCVVVVILLKELKIGNQASVLTGVWLALNPWHIHFSRASFEAVTALFFVLLGCLLFLRWTNRQAARFLYLSIISFSLSVWAYHAERLFTPLLFIFLLYIFRKKIWKSKIKELAKQRRVAFYILLVFAIPFLYLTFFTPAIGQRALSTSIMRDPFLTQKLHEGNYGNIIEVVFDNDTYLIFKHWLGKYLGYFDFRFWFWKGLALTPPQYPGIGLLYLVDLPLFLFGVYAFLSNKNEILRKLATLWFFVGPLPASFAMNDTHPLRALVWLPFFAITVGAGIDLIIRKKMAWTLYLFAALAALNYYYFTDIYFRQFPKYYSEFWQYGFKDIAIYACENMDKYEHVVVTDTFGSKGPLNTGIPSYYVLFYCPEDRGSFVRTGKHSKFLFHRPNYISDNKLKNTLRIGSVWDFDGEVVNEEDIIKKFYFKNGELAFIAVDKQVEKDEK